MSHDKPPQTRPRRGFGRLRQLPSRRWQAAYTGPDGVLYGAPHTYEAADDARAWLSAERKLIDLDVWTPPIDRDAARKSATSQTTLAEFAGWWITTRHTTRKDKHGRKVVLVPLAPRTAADYRRLLGRHILPTFGDVPIRAITSRAVDEWYKGLDPKKPTERSHAYQLMRAMLATAAGDFKRNGGTGERLLRENPATVYLGGQVESNHEAQHVKEDQLAVILDAMPDRLRLAVHLAYWGGLRYGEVAALRRGDIELTRDDKGAPVRGLVRVTRGVTWPDGVPTEGPPKSAAGVRVIHLPPHILADVDAHLRDHTENSKRALLFPNTQGGFLRPSSFAKPWQKARQAADLPGVHYHDLRHVSLTLAAQAGATTAELLARGGHSTPTVAARYQIAAAERDKELADRMSKGRHA